MKKIIIFLLLATNAFASEWTDEMVTLRSKVLTENISGKKLNSLIEEITLKFRKETDWLDQTSDEEVDKEGYSITLTTYFSARDDNSFEKHIVQSVIKDLNNSEYQKIKDKPAGDPEWLTLFEDTCKERRKIRLKALQKESPKIAFIKHVVLKPSFYAYTEGQSDAQNERNFEPNTALCMLDVKTGDVKTIIEDKQGRIRDVDVSFDGKRILFAWKKSMLEDDYHLYEMDIKSEKIRQLTFGEGVADYEGSYLPNGDIIFTSSRCVQTVDCWRTEVSNIYTCNKDGKYLRRLGFDQVHTTYPTVLNDGRVVYTRWDYNDRGQVYPQALFQMNPDGTGQTEYYGNNSWFPTVTHHARSLPNSSKLVAVLHGHHTWQAGQLAIIDRSKGTQEASGVQLIAPIRETKAIKIDKYGQHDNLFRHPYPLNEKEFIASMTTDPNARKNNRKNKSSLFKLYYIDIDGNRELLVSDPVLSCNHPYPLRSRKKPPVLASMVDYRKTEGTYFVQNVYEGPGLKGIPRGTIKKLRVVAIAFRAAPIGGTNSRGEAGGSFNSTPVACGNATWDPKTIIGETKVYEDGSAMFKAPANTPLYFQCIDANGHVAATMRSWSTLMPGEVFGCIGCHEDKMQAPPFQKNTLAMKYGAQELIPFYDLSGGFSYPKHVQPILDRHCISCHDGTKEKDGKKLMNLSATPMEDKAARRTWSASYLNLTSTQIGGGSRGKDDAKLVNWISSQSRPEMLPPYHRGAATSKLTKMLRDGHGKTKLNQKELDTISAWIDLCVPFCADYFEANTWSEQEMERYMRYTNKRKKYAAEIQENIKALIN